MVEMKLSLVKNVISIATYTFVSHLAIAFTLHLIVYHKAKIDSSIMCQCLYAAWLWLEHQ